MMLYSDSRPLPQMSLETAVQSVQWSPLRPTDSIGYRSRPLKSGFIRESDYEHAFLPPLDRRSADNDVIRVRHTILVRAPHPVFGRNKQYTHLQAHERMLESSI